MPLAVSFTAACARGLGLGNGEAPRVPTSVSVTAGVITITATYTITVSTFPLSRVEYRIARGGDAGQYAGSLPGANGSNSSGTISTRVTAAGVTENLMHDTNTYTIFFRAIDASGQISPETAGTAFTTGAEVAPTAVAPTLASLSVSHPTAPYIDIAWAAGTAGTYAIATRKYSVVAGTGAAGLDDTFTTVTGSTGTVRITTTAAGVAILPNTQYTVYMKYIASSPGTTSTTASATHTTAAEILADAPTISLASTPTAITITRGNYSNSPTYLQKYQYAYGTSASPTNYADFSSSDTTQTITGLLHATTFYVSIKAVSLVTGASGAISSTSIATGAEVAPTAVAPTLASTSVSHPTAPFVGVTWAAGTAGTYSIATRQYSVVAGTGAAGTFTTVSGTTGTVSPTTTAAGVAILPNTQYTVYMKYIASSPGATSTTASATHTTAAEIFASAPSVSLASTPTTITITRGDVLTPPTPTYLYKYQYAYGTSVDPTNFADFPTSGTASSVTLTGLTTSTTYYVRVRAIATGGALSPGAASSASIATAAEVAPTFTFTSANLTSTSVSHPTAPFISIAYTTGTAGTYSIATRQYSVVAGTGAAGAFTTISGSSPVSVTTTAAGAAILPGTQYTVYMKYVASSPGTTSTTISATHTTAAEILADAPTISLASTPTTITVTRGNYTTSPTYQQKYQYAYGTSVDPTNFADFPTSGTASSVTLTGLLHATTFYVRVRAIATGGALSPGAASSASIATGAEVAPTAVAPTLASTSVSHPTAPFVGITWAAGTAGTYAIATRQYSVVAGTGAAGEFTTVSGTTGTVSPTTTAAGVAILPNTQYTVYMKYIASSPGTTSTTASATHTTAAEIVANAPSISLASTSTTITITRGNYSNSPTYQQKYQYAYGTSASPTNFADFPTSGTASSVTLTGLTTSTTYYVRVRAIATGGALSPGAASTSPASIATAAEDAPTAVAPTFATATQLSITFTHAAGTAGTYPIATRKYSVVGGTVNITDVFHYAPYGTTQYTTSTVHAFSVGDSVTITGVSPSSFNVTGTIAGINSSNSFYFTLGPTGTYSSGGTVTGNAGADNTFTTVSGSTGTNTVTATAAGLAIVPGTSYKVFMKYTASSPGTASATASATHTTAAEVVANQITAAVALPTDTGEGRTQLIITRGNYSNSPTYLQNYQYAIGTSTNPTNWEYFPNWGFDATVTVAGLSNDTLYYVRTRAISTHSTLSGGVISGNATATTNPALPPTPTIAFRDMSSSSYGTAQFTIGNNGGSTTAVYIARRGISNNNYNAIFALKATGSQDITGYTSDGGTEYYVAYNYNRLGEASAPSNQIRWTRPAKNQGWNSGYIQPDAIYFSTTTSCTSEFAYTFGAVPSSDEEVGYIAVNKLYVEGIQVTSGSNIAGCAGRTTSLSNTSFLWWQSNSGHPSFTDGFGTSTTSGFAAGWGTGTFTSREVSLSAWGGANISGKYFLIGSNAGTRTAGCAVGCSGTSPNLNAYRMKNFLISGVTTTAGSIGT